MTTIADRWRELLNEFRRIDDRSLRIDVAAWSTGWTTYNVCGGDVPTSRGRYAAVAARAGALLAETQAVRLAAAAAAENDPLRRWCAYLADNYCRFVGTGSDADGAELAFGAVESATEAAELALQEIIAVVDAEGEPEDAPTGPTMDHGVTAAKALADDNYPAVAEIASAEGLALDEKMRRIALVYSQATGWKSRRWSDLLGVTEGRIRQSDTWKVWRRANARD